MPHVLGLGARHAGPPWFTGVMGTGILAICLSSSPIPIPFGRALAVTLWGLDTVVFVLISACWLAGRLRDRAAVRASLADPVRAQAWGAPPMACFTIAVGLLRIGPGVLPAEICVPAAQWLFVLGVLGSLASAFVVPFWMFTTHELTRERTIGSWLLPVVPPIVASVPAALLSSTWPAALRGDLLALAYALLGIGLALAAIVTVLFYGRLVYHKVPEAAVVPTTWLVVGPLGQSIAGLIALGGAAQAVWPTIGHALLIIGVAYGVLAWGFAMYWLAMAIALTLRAARGSLAFNLGWWAFTFPVGVLTAGTDALFAQTHAALFAVAATLLLTLLATMWSLVASQTIRFAIRNATASLRSNPVASVAKLSNAA
jgi:C4-dicarboxylate transporter/malic acid transport protein